MARHRSREAETEDVNPRRLRRGAVKRQHLGRWAVGHDELAPGVIGPTHLSPGVDQVIRDVAGELTGQTYVATVTVAGGAQTISGVTPREWDEILTTPGFEGFDDLTTAVAGPELVAPVAGTWAVEVTISGYTGTVGSVAVLRGDTQVFPETDSDVATGHGSPYREVVVGLMFEDGEALSVTLDGAGVIDEWVLRFSLIEPKLAPAPVVAPTIPPSYAHVDELSELLIAGGIWTGPYYAFPGLGALPGDDLIIVARKAPDHYVGGDLVKFTSTNNGVSWSSETTIRDTAKDIRTAEILRLANGNLLLTFTDRSEPEVEDFTPYSMVSTDNGATWGTPVAITNGFTGWSFVESRAVQFANGDLLVAMYGIDTGGNQYTRVSKSTNNGTSWSALSTIVAADVDGRVWQEPYLTVDPGTGTVYCAMRSDSGTPGIYLCESTDSGATWSAPVRQFNGSGRPALHWTVDDALAVMYRHTSAETGRPAARFSFDAGATWSDPFLFNSSAVYVYGSWLDLSDGTLGAVWSVEQSAIRSDLVFDVFEYVGA